MELSGLNRRRPHVIPARVRAGAIWVAVLLSAVGVVAASAARLEGVVVDTLGRPVPGVRVTLRPASADPAAADVSQMATTDNAGRFAFDGLPPGPYTVVAEQSGYAPAVQSPVRLDEGHPVSLRLTLRPQPFSETVNIVGGSPADVQSPDELKTKLLAAVPLPTDRFEEVLPLLPGVVRDRRGRLSFSGTRPSQSTLLVNGMNATDPVTGEFAQELPLSAIETIDVHTIPYSAEFGRVTGAVANVRTRSGVDEWDFQVGSVIPSLRFRDGGLRGINSATPRAQVSGPLRKGRAWIAQGFSYRFVRARVYEEMEGRDEGIIEGFDAFTQIDLRLGDRHAITATFSYFPAETDNLGIDSLHPEAATPDLATDGWNLAFSDRLVTSASTIWETLFAVRSLDVTIRPKGIGPSRLTASSLRDNYFNEIDRDSTQVEWNLSCLHAPSLGPGRHLVKFGSQLYYTRFGSLDASGPVEIVGAGGRPLTRISFTGPGELDGSNLALGLYLQDRWQITRRAGLDVGLRYDFDRLTSIHHVAPRIAAAYALDPGGRTFIRAGWGVFFDQVFLHADAFERFQQRTETRLDATGAPDGPPLVFRNRVDAEGLSLPRSKVWNVELDRSLGDRWMLRVNYRELRGRHQAVVDRVEDGPGGPALVLSSRGRSTARQFDTTLRLALAGDGEWFFSFAKSRATGDLNAFTELYGNLREPILLPSEEGPLAVDVPHRFLAWGLMRLPWKLTLVPALEWRSGFPYTTYAEDYTPIGPRHDGRFPAFFSLDLQVMRALTLFGRDVGVALFNLSGHDNPRDVVSNVASPLYESFRNSVDTSVSLRVQTRF